MIGNIFNSFIGIKTDILLVMKLIFIRSFYTEFLKALRLLDVLNNGTNINLVLKTYFFWNKQKGKLLYPFF